MTTLVAPPLWAVGPFVLMLLAIAICPLTVPHWWEPNRNKLVVSAVLGAPVLILYLVRRPSALVGTAEEYVSFIVMLGGLYVISGGILLPLLIGFPSRRSKSTINRFVAEFVHREFAFGINWRPGFQQQDFEAALGQFLGGHSA